MLFGIHNISSGGGGVVKGLEVYSFLCTLGVTPYVTSQEQQFYQHTNGPCHKNTARRSGLAIPVDCRHIHT